MMVKACENVTTPMLSAACMPQTCAARSTSGAWVQALDPSHQGGLRRNWAPRRWRSAASAWYGQRRGGGPQRRTDHA